MYVHAYLKRNRAVLFAATTRGDTPYTKFKKPNSNPSPRPIANPTEYLSRQTDT
jgi:hypothetical protein